MDKDTDANLNKTLESELGEIELEWENIPTLADLKGDLEEATPYQQDKTKKIGEWLDNLNVEGKAKVKKTAGRSSVVPKLIRKQAEWRYSSLSEPFLSTDNLFKASPVSFEDVESSKQNSLVLNHQFNNKIDKNRFIDEYVRTAVDEGTAIIRVGWKYAEETYSEEVPIVEMFPDPQMGPILEEAMALQEENPNEFHRIIPEELKQAIEASLEDQIPYRPEVTGTEVVEKTRIVYNCPTLEICNYNNVYVDPTCGNDLSKAAFLIYSFESSKSELEKDGRYRNLDKISTSTETVLAQPDHVASTGVGDFNFKDEPRKKFVVHEYWGFRDIDGSGVVKPFVAAWVGKTLVRMEENPFPDKALPFVMVQYLPVRRSVYGEPDGALLEENQQITGAVTRGMIDILGRSANGQTGIRRDMLDAVNRRKYERGNDYEFNVNVDPRQGIHMHTYPEIPNSAQFMLGLQNQEAESLTGVKAFSGGLTGDALGQTATGARGVLDAASKRELGILRRLAAGLVEVGKKVIAMNGEFLSEVEVIRLTNDQFIEVRKDELQGAFDLKLTISTAEEDDAKAQELSFMMQTIGNNVDFSITQKILSKIFDLRKMPDLSKDIENYQPQPDPMAQQIQQLEMQKLQMEIEEIKSRTAENYAEAGLDQARAASEGVKAQAISSDIDQKALDFVEQESGTKQERELQKQKAQSQGNIELKLTEHELAKDRDVQSTLLKDYLQRGQ